MDNEYQIEWKYWYQQLLGCTEELRRKNVIYFMHHSRYGCLIERRNAAFQRRIAELEADNKRLQELLNAANLSVWLERL